MRIGIHPALKRHDGGIYQYTVTFLDALNELTASGAFSQSHEFVVFVHEPDDPVLSRFTNSHWSIKPFRPPWAPRPMIDLDEFPNLDSPREQPDMRAWLQECGIDLMLYPSPHRLSFESGIPFVMAIHDVQHRLQPEFPEVSADGEWERREYVFRNAARKAVLLVANSETGRRDLLDAYAPYGLTPDRVKVLPYAPGLAIDSVSAAAARERIRKRFTIPERYLFYPAQFWPHKNHLRLVEALGQLREQSGLTIPLVLAGGWSGEIRERVRAEVEARAKALGVGDQLVFLGYVTDEEITGLYAGATALVMPTFFGPTSIPVLEAWELDCPVLASDVPGNREQIGDAGILVDPRNADDIAAGIQRLWTDSSIRQTLIVRGRKKRSEYTSSDFQTRLLEILAAACDLLCRLEHRLVEVP